MKTAGKFSVAFLLALAIVFDLQDYSMAEIKEAGKREGESESSRQHSLSQPEDSYLLCGPVCVCIVMKEFKINISMEEAIELTGANIDGSTMLGLKRAFEAKGLTAKGFKMSSQDLLETEVPAILFINDDHFMVVNGSKDSSFIVIDYPKEPYLMPAEELNGIWHGEALLVSDSALDINDERQEEEQTERRISMNNQEMTRREMIRFLGIEVPMVLLAVQVLPNMAGAEEQYTQLSYRISAAKRDGFMGDYSNKSIICSEYRDAEGKAVGTRILEMDEASAKSNIIKEGDIIFRINDQPFIVGSAEDYEKWSKSIVEMIFEKKRITMDIDRDNKHYLISADFE